MFCPKCKAEYKEGIVLCADCNVPLVSELLSSQVSELVEFEEILTTFNPGDIAVIKSLLDSTDIVYYFHGEFFNYADPLIQPARLMVHRAQAHEARELLRDLKITYTISAPLEDEEPKND